MHRWLGGQSRVSVQAMWHLRNAHTRGDEQSVLMTHPSPAAADWSLEQAPATRMVVSTQKMTFQPGILRLGRIVRPYQNRRPAIIHNLVYDTHTDWIHMDRPRYAARAYAGSLASGYE